MDGSFSLFDFLLQVEAEVLSAFDEFLVLEPILNINQAIQSMILIDIPQEEKETYLVCFTTNNRPNGKLKQFSHILEPYVLHDPSVDCH